MSLREQGGSSHDGPEAIRLGAVATALRSGCMRTLGMPDGGELHVPMFLAADAALAASEGKSEADWRRAWTLQQVRRAAAHPGDPRMLEEAVAILNATEAIIADQKAAGVWPWQPAARRRAG